MLGADEGGPAETLFGVPAAVVASAPGHIYVADRTTSDVRVFDADGRFVRTVGSRGRAPGEFLSVHALALDGTGRLVVCDNDARRVSVFDEDGNLAGPTHKLDLWADELLALPSTGVEPAFLALSFPEPYAPRDAPLFHALDETFQPAGTFGSQSNLGDAGDFLRWARYATGGDALVTRDGQHVVYAPGVHEGRLLRYDARAGGTWSDAEPLQGVAFADPASESFEVSAFDRETMIQVSSIPPGGSSVTQVVGRINAHSAGLFELDDGRLVHFVFVNGEEVETGYLALEVYDAEGRLVGQGRFDEEPFGAPVRGSAQIPLLDVAWRDDAGRFYVIDRNEVPVVRVVELVF